MVREQAPVRGIARLKRISLEQGYPRRKQAPLMAFRLGLSLTREPVHSVPKQAKSAQVLQLVVPCCMME